MLTSCRTVSAARLALLPRAISLRISRSVCSSAGEYLRWAPKLRWIVGTPYRSSQDRSVDFGTPSSRETSAMGRPG